MLEPGGAPRDERVLRRLAHADDQGEPKSLAVGAIQASESVDVVRAEPIEPRRGLLVRRLPRERALPRLAPRELGMGPDQLELALTGRLAPRRLERRLELSHRGERPPAPRRLGNPR